MRNEWSGLWLLLVVPWLVNCVSGPVVRLDTGEGSPIVYTPPAAEPPLVELHQEEFLDALVELMLNTPLAIRPQQRQGQVVLASWGGSQDHAQDLLLNLCPPEESPNGCLTLPENAHLRRPSPACAWPSPSPWTPSGKVLQSPSLSSWILSPSRSWSTPQ